MSVVDHRAACVAHGRRASSRRSVGGSFTSPASASMSMTALLTAGDKDKDALLSAIGRGAFHGHGSVRNLNLNGTAGGAGKYRGLDTEAARGVSESRRNLGGSYSGVHHEDLGTAPDAGKRKSSRLSLLGGVSYGAASVKRLEPEADIEMGIGETTATVALKNSLGSTGRAASISAGEGAWLVKQHSSGRRKSTKKSVVVDKKDSDAIIPDVEQPKAAKTKVQLASGAKAGGGGRSVSFSTVSIRYYPVILGNNPFVTSGPPLELAWDCERGATETGIPVNSYESARASVRRGEWDLALSRGERESRLLESGFTREEIAGAVRETSRVKAQRANTVLNLKMAGVEEFTEDVKRQTAKAVGLRKSSDWMYQEWKKKNDGRANFSNTRADIIFQQEQDRRANRGLSPASSTDREMSESVHGGPKKGLVQRFKNRNRSQSPPQREMEEERPPSPHFDGPAFGIGRTSLSTRFFGDADGVGGSNGGTAPLWPFALVKVVYPDSPASEAGLQRGDKIIKLGTITAMNHDHCRAIPGLGQAAAAKESSLSMLVEDEKGERRDVTIKPRRWKGRGHFGFLFRELGTEMEE